MSTPIPPVGNAPAPKTRLEDLYKEDPKLRDKVAAIHEEGQKAINILKTIKVDVSDQRKAMAQQKVQRIKASIQALKMSGIVDSKILARIAARLARELAGA